MPKAPDVPEKLSRSQAALIFAIALVARLIHIWSLRDSPFFAVLIGDSRGYDDWAQSLATGDWIGSEVFYQAPLYPYFLGIIYSLFGRDLLVVRVVQALIGSVACVLLGLAGARLVSARVGFIAGLMLAVYAPCIFLDALIQKSTLDIFLVCLSLWLISTILTAPRPPGAQRHWLALGITLGALTLNRENAIVLLVVVLAWVAITEWHEQSTQPLRLRFPGTRALLFGLIIALAPVTARNYVVGGGVYLTTSQFGSNFYIGNNPRADGTYMALREGRGDPAFERQDATEIAEQELKRRLAPAAVSSFWRDRALLYIVSEPADWLKLLGRKVVLLFNATEMIDTEAQESHAEWSPLLRWTALVGHFGILMPLALAGVAGTWQQRSRLWIVYAMAIAYAASVIAFFVVARYRYPLVPFVTLFAAAGLARLPALVRERSLGSLPLALGAITLAAFAQWPVLSADVMRAITETNLATALQARSDLDAAIRHYRRAVEIRPDYAPAYNNLGVALRAQGKLDDAIAAYRQALAQRPDYTEVHYNLATALLEQGKADEALAHFRRGRTAMPVTAAAHNNFGVALASVGHRNEAIAEFQAALALEPKSLIALRNLGDAAAKQGRYEESIGYFRRIAELEPGNPAAHYDLGNVLMEAKRVSEAEAEYRQTLRLAPGSAQAHSNLGVALAAQGKIDEAIVEFERALKAKPDFKVAQRYLEMTRRSRGQ